MYLCRKRLAAFALSALMSLSCISCGKSDDSSQAAVTQAETTADITTTVTTTMIKTTATITENTAETTEQTTTEVTTTTEKTQTETPKASAAPKPVVQTAAPAPKPASTSYSGTDLDSVVKNYPYNSSVILYCMDGKTLYSNDPNRVYYGASMIKLPYVYYCCTQLEKGVHSLDETVTYTADQYYPGTGVIIHRGVGKKYTVEQLIDYTLRYSDNVAYIMLVKMFGIDGFNKMMKDWGCGDIQLYSYSYFADVTPSFILTAMQKMQKMSTSNSRAWQAAWKGLLGSEGLRIKNYFSNESVAGKYGLYSGVYHEACYFGGKEPYILVVMTEISGYNTCDSYMANVAAAARAEVNKYTAEKEAAAKATATTTAPATTTTQTLLSVTEKTTEETPQVTTPPETTPGITETYETIADTNESER